MGFRPIESIFCCLLCVSVTASTQAQCPAPTYTPVNWGSSSGNFSDGAGMVTLSGDGGYTAGQTSENSGAAYVTLGGDGQIQAKLESVTGFLGANVAAGLFIRGGTAASGDGGILAIWGGSLNTVKFADRTHSGPLTQLDSAGLTLPCWLRLQNNGYVLSPSISTDGANWTPMPTPSYNLSGDTPSFNGATLICGLVVLNETVSSPSTAVFSSVCVFPLSSPLPTPSPTPTASSTPSPTPNLSPLPTLTPTPTPGRFVWPNPFTPQLPTNNMAHFNLPGGHGAGKFLIADLKRQKVRSEDFSAGQGVTWDGRDDTGNLVSAGVYIYLLESDGTVRRGTVTVLR